MIDQVSNKGFAEVSQCAAVAASGAGSGVLNLLLGPGGSGAVNAPTNGQPQGTIAFILDAAPAVGTGTITTMIQTSSDNTNWSNVTGGAFAAVSSVANTGGVQVVYIDTAILNTYNRSLDVLSGTANVTRSVVAVFVPKNP